MDRLSSIDASFLTNETSSAHMHVGAILIFEGPPPSYNDFLAHVESRLHLVPRFRQKLAFPPVETGRPFWVDDPSFNLAYHVRHSALPAPGSEEQLRNIAGRLFSQALDRSKPLWEIWLVQGLERNRFALITKTHHALVDGVAGVDIASVLFDVKPVPEPIEPDREWVPRPTPSQAELAARGLVGAAETPFKLARRALRAAGDPERTVKRVAEAGEALAEVAWNLTNPAPEVPLNPEIGSHRRFAWTRAELGDFKKIKDVLGGTVNDVVLTLITNGYRELLENRGETIPPDRVVRTMVPVSVRAPGERGEYNNRVSAVFARLPVGMEDPAERLADIRAQMDGIKSSKQAVAGDALAQLSGFAPPMLLALGSRVATRSARLNMDTATTNVPGPQVALHTLDRKLVASYPYVPVVGTIRIVVAIFSYDGELYFGVTGDRDHAPDVDVLTEGIEADVDSLLTRA
jgi:diacylglycerol O-acyltransferase